MQCWLFTHPDKLKWPSHWFMNLRFSFTNSRSIMKNCSHLNHEAQFESWTGENLNLHAKVWQTQLIYGVSWNEEEQIAKESATAWLLAFQSGEYAIQQHPSVAVLNCWTQFTVVWRTGTLLFLLMLTWHLNLHREMVVESSFLRSVPIVHVWCLFSQCFMMTDAFNLITVRHKL